MDMERLQNLLARRGVASRRGAADIIRAGRVRVDGVTVTEPGARIAETAHIEVDGRLLKAKEEPHRTFLYHKPVGEVCSTDGQGARSVLEAFRGINLRLVPVGRLDKESEGLLLVSNDGALIQRLTHPRFGHTKIYEVEVNAVPTEAQLAILRGPMTLEGYKIRPVRVETLGGRRLRFTLTEGRHRQIRQMCEQAHLRVTRLRRVALGTLRLGSLPPGRWRELSAAELNALRGMPDKNV